jgi:Protein of unknown function (DUF3025)
MIEQIDWNRPWLASLQPFAAPVLHADWRSAINAEARRNALKTPLGLPVRFVPQEDLPAGMAYETFINDTGNVPTRNNLHDFFNALVWQAFPQTKLRLMALHAQEIARRAPNAHRERAERGALRDAATIFDENGALFICAKPALSDALRNHRWHQLFLERRADFGCAWDLQLFGHALMEKLIKPYKGITAHVWIIAVEPSFFSMSRKYRNLWIDTYVALQLPRQFGMTDLTPLPIAGVPGWWACQDDAFYSDAGVFRPKRIKPAISTSIA